MRGIVAGLRNLCQLFGGSDEVNEEAKWWKQLIAEIKKFNPRYVGN